HAPEDMLGITRSLHELGAANSDLGKLEVAKGILEDIYRLRMEHLGQDHIDTIRAGYEVAVIRQRMGETDGLIEFYRDLLSRPVPDGGFESDKLYAALHSGFAAVLSNAGHFQEASENVDRSIEYLNRT